MTDSLNIITANHLRSGLNVYFFQEGPDSRWDTDISKASVFPEDDLAEAFDRAKRDMADNIVVDCAVIPVDKNHNPLTTREKIRAEGPSTRYGHAVNL